MRSRGCTRSRCSSATRGPEGTPTPWPCRARAAGSLALDTGFLVHNERNYPRLSRLFRELGVAVQDSRMSFSVVCERHGLEYSAVRLWQQPRALVHPGFAGLLREIVRFLRTAAGRARGAPRAQHARRLRAHRGLLPLLPRPLPGAVRLGAVVHRARADPLLPRPPTRCASSRTTACWDSAATRWRTVVGGSRRYVAAITAPLGERLRLARRGAGRHPRRRRRGGAHRRRRARTASTPWSSPTHAPQALAMLGRRRRPRARRARRLPHHPQQHRAPHRRARCSRAAGAPRGPPGTTRWTTATSPAPLPTVTLPPQHAPGASTSRSTTA